MGFHIVRWKLTILFLRDLEGGYLPSLPPEKTIFAALVQNVVQDISAAMDTILQETKSKYCYWMMADVVKGDLALRAQNRKRNAQSRGRKYYKPWFVTGRNCASNVGIHNDLQ